MLTRVRIAWQARAMGAPSHWMGYVRVADVDAKVAEARALAASMDLDLAWEFAAEGEFGFADLAADYFSDKPSLSQQARNGMVEDIR